MASLGTRRRLRASRRMSARSPARALEIFLHPGIVEAFDLVQRIGDQHALLAMHRDAIADRIQRIEIVRDQEHREAEALAQRQDQLIERGRADRIEARGRLVEKQDLGIERERRAPARRA